MLSQDVSLSEARALLDFIYRGQFSVRKEEVEGLMKVAETLQVKGLLKHRDSLEAVRPTVHSDHNYHLPLPDYPSPSPVTRTQFTQLQLKVLQEYFEKNSFCDPRNVEYLSQQLGLSPRVIMVWFQNSRQKQRKIAKKQARQYQCEHCLEEFQTYLDLIIHQVQPCLQEVEEEEEDQQEYQATRASRESTALDSDPGAEIVLSDQLEQLMEEFEQFSEKATAEDRTERDQNQNRKLRNGASFYGADYCEPGTSVVVEESQKTSRPLRDSSASIRIVNVKTLLPTEWSLAATEETQHGKMEISTNCILTTSSLQKL